VTGGRELVTTRPISGDDDDAADVFLMLSEVSEGIEGEGRLCDMSEVTCGLRGEGRGGDGRPHWWRKNVLPTAKKADGVKNAVRRWWPANDGI